MKRYIAFLGFFLVLFGMVFASNYKVNADSSINGQVTTTVTTNRNDPSYKNYSVAVSAPGTGQISSVPITSFDPISTVPTGLYIGHVITSKSTIDVQRFIDPSTSIACYYSEIAGAVIEVNCVPVSPNAK